MKRIFTALFFLHSFLFLHGQGICDSIITINPIDDLCPSYGDIVVLEASHPGGTFSGPFVSNGILNVLDAPSGDYEVTYTIVDNNCTLSIQEDFTILEIPFADAFSTGQVDCANPGASTITLEGFSSGDFAYWSNDEDIISTEDNITVDYGGNYYYVVEDFNLSCPAIIRIEVPQINTPNVDIGGCDHCGVFARLGVENMPANSVARWRNIDYNSYSILGECATIPSNLPGLWQLQVTDTISGCISTDVVNIPSSYNSVPSASAGATSAVTCGAASSLLGAYNPTEWDFEIEWTTDNGIIVANADQLIPTIEGPGSYILTVTNPITGCADIDTVTAAPAPFSFFYDESICAGESLLGHTTTGTYFDTIPGTTPNSCDTINVLNLIVFDSIIVEAAVIADNGAGNGAVVLDVSGGAAPFQFSWSDGVEGTEPFRSGLAAGDYTVSLTSADGCMVEFDFIIELDPLGGGATSQLDGQVFFDANENCQLDPGEIGLAGIHVSLQGAITLAQNSSLTGNYEFPLNTGVYLLQATPPSQLWEACTDSILVDLANDFDTLTVNYPMQAAISSPLMSVEINTPFLRRCFENNYTVNYVNNGTAIATDAFVEITFAAELNVVGSSIPWSSVDGTTYTFDLGDIEVNESGTFTITVIPICPGTTLGQIHCVEAHIYPDTIPELLAEQWEGAIITVEGECIDGELFFDIINVGQGDMVMPLQYIVIEDAVLNATGIFDLTSGQTDVVSVTGNGSTFWLRAEQEAGAPADPFPGFALEGCTTNTDTAYSLGYMNDFLLSDLGNFIAIDCDANVGSYDPNQKSADPAGYLEEHYIEPGVALEYMIEFQNTGTDTAFRVVLVDTLSTNLDLSTLQFLGSSHAVNYQLHAGRALVFTFDPIELPDSNVNEVASHGFVKFKIAPHSDLAANTLITNAAEIYFDFNEAIHTDPVYHTIWEGSVFEILVSEVKLVDPAMGLKVFPNPFQGTATVQLEGDFDKKIYFTLFDVQGRKVYEKSSVENQFEVAIEGLAQGLYFFTLRDEKHLLGSGKMMME